MECGGRVANVRRKIPGILGYSLPETAPDADHHQMSRPKLASAGELTGLVAWSLGNISSGQFREPIASRCADAPVLVRYTFRRVRCNCVPPSRCFDTPTGSTVPLASGGHPPSAARRCRAGSSVSFWSAAHLIRKLMLWLSIPIATLAKADWSVSCRTAADSMPEWVRSSRASFVSTIWSVILPATISRMRVRVSRQQRCLIDQTSCRGEAGFSNTRIIASSEKSSGANPLSRNGLTNSFSATVIRGIPLFTRLAVSGPRLPDKRFGSLGQPDIDDRNAR